MEYAFFLGVTVKRIIASLLLVLSTTVAWGAETCITDSCHANFKKTKVPHKPVNDGNCSACHKAIKDKTHPIKGEKTFELTGKISALCAKCHKPLGKKKNVHQPVKDGECLACHKVHGSDEKYLLDVGGDQAKLCYTCHDEKSMTGKFTHGPAVSGDCKTCHTPHESDKKGLLKGSMKTLCLECHDDFAQSMKSAKVLHAPVQIDDCSACHKPHASEFKYFLKKNVSDLCLGCHSKIAKKHNDSKVRHKPLAQPQGCGGCHNTHFSASKGLLIMNEKDMCLTCHGVDNLGNPPLRNIRKELANKPYLHGPLKKDRCTPCHDPHGSNSTRILKGNYPAQLYTPYKDDSFSLCMNCHNKNLLKFAETTVYTRFRNGSQNLHYVHVANKRKGRSCKLCHDTHASDGIKLLAPEGAPFGSWKIPLRLEMTETGGSCAPGCHRKYGYDRVKPVINIQEPQKAEE
jgi:predicted CXXCH cytochrome family protein